MARGGYIAHKIGCLGKCVEKVYRHIKFEIYLYSHYGSKWKFS